MKNTVFYLSTCSTCNRIIKEVQIDDSFRKQDIKVDKIQVEQIEDLANMAGSYEALFSRKAMKYKSMNLKEKNLSEEDYKNLILQEYTFLKRPVFVIENEIFIGNAKSNIEAIMRKLQE